MAGTEPPTKRIRYDFTTTFDVIVGSAKGREKHFPVYHDLLTARSDFLLAARAAQPQQPVRLDDEDPEVFSLYLNCVHSGIEVVRAGGELLGNQFHSTSDGVGGLVKREYDIESRAEESEDDHDRGRFEALIRLHLLASRLQDFRMMNSAVDELVQMIDEDSLIPMQVNLVYSSTKRGDPLRTLVRDVYLHEAESSENHEFLQTSELHSDFWRDISLEYFKRKDTAKSIGEVYGLKIGKDKGVSRCDYHQRKIDDEVEIVPPPTASSTGAAGAAAVSMTDHAPLLPRTSAAASGVAAHGYDPAAPQTSGQSGRPSNTTALVATEQRSRTAPQSSARSRGTTAVAAVGVAEQLGPAMPQQPARRGRPSGTGTFVFRRPETPDVWWSVSADRFDNARTKERYRYTRTGRAQEEGTFRTVPCDRCERKGHGDTCSSLPGERCGRCLWDKAPVDDGC